MRKSLLYDGFGRLQKLQEKGVCPVWKGRCTTTYRREKMSLYTKIIDLQKLDVSRQKVLKNKPAPGVDGITYDMIMTNNSAGM